MVAAGCTIEAAARYVCCSVVTIRREARRNAQFHEHLRQSRVAAQLSPVRTMREAAASNWRAAAWMLERTEPHRYGKRDPHTFSEAEIVELLGRVCDAVRRETRDKPTFARIKRRVRAIAQSALRQSTGASLAETLPAPPEVSSAAAGQSVADEDQPLPAAERAGVPSARAADQNVTNEEPIMIRASDIPLGNSSTSPRAEAT